MKYEGIQVFRSSVQNEDLMYNNGYQWEITIDKFGSKQWQNCDQGTTVDPDNQYDHKDLIFRASNASDNQWVVIYNKKWRNISCYSPQVKKLVTNKTKCRELNGRNQIVVKAIDPSIVKSIDGIVEKQSGNVIHGYYVFFRRDGRPVICDKSMFDPKNRCKEKTDIREKKTSPKDTK
ncbi:unnamed protein product [Medioppia subpectinata]|uniref:Uncharacterized protein n=1 Tax=Medioppia subpectinata TaxID=1979941 RepID=A0A7R9KIP9_9ACAR|nr:unnamed protein product [Medioppia subpectinata]CAG2104420.1 unnamed protein product [Medioppia subpectinata]